MHSLAQIMITLSVLNDVMIIYNLNNYSWSPDVVWLHGMIVQWNGESFRAEGPQNVAIPCVSSQECFYVCLLDNIVT